MISNKEVLFQEHKIKTTISIGVAEINIDDTRYEDLISNADIALYKAKALGRNRLCLAQELVKTE